MMKRLKVPGMPIGQNGAVRNFSFSAGYAGAEFGMVGVVRGFGVILGAVGLYFRGPMR
jgi:hypothetical protein